METEQYDEAVRDYEKVHKGDRGNQEYRYLIIISPSAWLNYIPSLNFEFESHALSLNSTGKVVSCPDLPSSPGLFCPPSSLL